MLIITVAVGVLRHDRAKHSALSQWIGIQIRIKSMPPIAQPGIASLQCELPERRRA